jgi:hypothetical protein
MKKITIGTKVKALVGHYKNDIGEVTLIIQTDRKRYNVNFDNGRTGLFFYTHLSTKV